MKNRTILSGLLLLSSVHLAAQSPYIEVLDQMRPVVHYYGALPVDSALVVLASSDPGGDPYIEKRLLKYSPSGQVIDSMELDIPIFDLRGMQTRAADGGAWLAGPLDGCDVFFTGQIQRFDRYGNLVFERVYDQSELIPNSGVSGIAKAPIDRLALIGGGVIITDTLGNVLEQWVIPFSQITGPASWYMDDLLITSGSSHVYLRGASGTVLHSRNLGSYIHDLVALNDQIWVLCSNSLYQLDEELEVIDSIPLPADYTTRQFVEGGNAPHFQLADTLYQYGSGQGIVPVLTPSLLEGQIIHSFFLRDDLVHVLGAQVLDLDPYDLLGPYAGGLLRSYAMNGATSMHNEDVTLEELTMDSLWFNANGSGTGGHQYGDVSVTVRNLGTEPLHDFMLAHRSGLMNVTCGIPTNYISVTNANIAPGASATFSMPNVLLWLGQISPGDVIEHTVCVTALGPNGLMDRNIEDNTTCTPLLITMNISVGMDEERSIASVHPSPFTDQFIIDMIPDGNAHIRLHDAKGMVVLEHPLAGPGRHVIPANGLPSGMYFLTVASDGGVNHFKLVRE